MNEKDDGKPSEPEPKLPKASVEKIISEVLPYNMTCSREVKQILLNSCAEFVHIVATEANEMCEREQKKTVTHEHVYAALRSLGYGAYVEECSNSYTEHVEQTKLRPSRQDKFEESGLSMDELGRQQQELFDVARQQFNRANRDQT